MTTAADREAGIATVTALALIVMVAATAMVGVLVGAAVAARHRAGAAADLAAIAAAARSYDVGAACRAAARIAGSNRARVESCRLRGTIAEVRVRVPVPGVFGRLGPARATARAGPLVGD